MFIVIIYASYFIFYLYYKKKKEVTSTNRAIGLRSRVFANGLGDQGSIPSQIIPKTQKWYLMLSCSTLSIIRYGLRVKCSNPGKGMAPTPTPRCSSYGKGSLRITLDDGRQQLTYNEFRTRLICFFFVLP